MPFTKVSRNKFESPSGKEFTKKQVGLCYHLGGHFPGQKGMGDQLPKSPAHFSPTAPGEMARPTLTSSGAINAATSPTPTSILAGTKQTFGPLEYATRDRSNQEYWRPDRVADREVRRARKEYNRRK